MAATSFLWVTVIFISAANVGKSEYFQTATPNFSRSSYPSSRIAEPEVASTTKLEDLKGSDVTVPVTIRSTDSTSFSASNADKSHAQQNTSLDFSSSHPFTDSSTPTTEYSCEDTVLNFSCEEDKVIKIVQANYGRLVRDLCNDYGHLRWSGEDCKANNAYFIINDRCSQKQTCSIEASNKVFGDPCVETFKYLEVQYVCEPLDALSSRRADVVHENRSLSCEKNWKRFGENCYLVEKSRLDWEAASTRCRNLGGYLASIHSKEENDFLYRFKDIKGYPFSAWIGRRDLDGDGTSEWEDGTETDYTNWITRSYPGFISCAALDLTTYRKEWKFEHCVFSYPYICKKRIPVAENSSTEKDNIPENFTSNGYVTTASANDPTPCEEGWTRYKQYCYIVKTDKKWWLHAFHECSSLTGGNLASIHSTEQNDFLADMMLNKSVTNSWIGLNARIWDHIYTWMDGSDVDFTDCRAWQPYSQCPLIGDCFELLSDTQRVDFARGWNDSSCITRKNFICQKPILRTENINEGKDFELGVPIPNVTPARVNTSSDCEEDWLQYGQNCYILKRNKRTWKGASSLCSSIGGRLASIHSKEQNDFLKNMMIEKVVRRCWIGGFNCCAHKNMFEWEDGSDVDFYIKSWPPFMSSIPLIMMSWFQ